MLVTRALALALALAPVAALPEVARADGPVAAAVDGPGFALRGASVGVVEASGTTLAFDAELSNPTPAPVCSAKCRSRSRSRGSACSRGPCPAASTCRRAGAAKVPFPGRFRYADLPGVAAKVALGRRVPYRLVATAEVRTAAGTILVPVAYDGDLSMPKLPELGLAGLRILSMNPFDAGVEVSVALENVNAFPLPAGLLRYRITIAEGELSSAEVALPAVGPGGKAVIAIPLKLSLKRVGKGVVTALKGDAATVGLHAVASVGELAYPVDLEARLPTRR